MQPQEIIENLRKLRTSENNAKKIKNGVNNDIAALNLAIDEAIDNGEEVIKMREFRNERINKEGYRKQLQSEIHKLSAAFDDILFERGEFDASQLRFFDMENNQEENDDDFFQNQNGQESESDSDN